MTTWRDLSGGPLAILGGEALLLGCSVCYLLWWSVVFAPRAGAPRSGGGLFLAGAALGGFAGLGFLAVGLMTLLGQSPTGAVGAVVVGGLVVGVLLGVVTAGPLQRPLTSELPLIVLWATAQLAVGVGLTASGRLSAPALAGWIVAVALATVVGVGCYLAFYRLDPVPAYWVGMLPLAVDGVVAVVLALLVLAGG